MIVLRSLAAAIYTLGQRSIADGITSSVSSGKVRVTTKEESLATVFTSCSLMSTSKADFS